jgi:hypothetical protein
VQGQNKTVYVGGTAAMDSLNEILLYNHLVFENLGLQA